MNHRFLYISCVLILICLFSSCGISSREKCPLNNEEDGGQRSEVILNGVSYLILEVDEKANRVFLLRKDTVETAYLEKNDVPYAGSVADRYLEEAVYPDIVDYLGEDAVPLVKISDSLTGAEGDSGIKRHVFALALSDVFTDYEKGQANVTYGFTFDVSTWTGNAAAYDKYLTEPHIYWMLRTATSSGKQIYFIQDDGSMEVFRFDPRLGVRAILRPAFYLNLSAVEICKEDDNRYSVTPRVRDK